MRLMLCAPIVAAIAAAVLICQAQAAPAFRSEPARPPEMPVQASGTAHSPSNVKGLGMTAIVVKDFGASIRTAPAADAPVLFNTACGAAWPVLLVEGGWVKVKTDAGAGWIGGSRVAVTNTPPTIFCKGHRFLYPTAEARTAVPTGCLTLRSRPSDEASTLDCVSNGHLYTVVDGPFDPGSGQDWFKVTSGATGTGWTPADNLFPL